MTAQRHESAMTARLVGPGRTLEREASTSYSFTTWGCFTIFMMEICSSSSDVIMISGGGTGGEARRSSWLSVSCCTRPPSGGNARGQQRLPPGESDQQLCRG